MEQRIYTNNIEDTDDDKIKMEKMSEGSSGVPRVNVYAYFMARGLGPIKTSSGSGGRSLEAPGIKETEKMFVIEKIPKKARSHRS